MAKIVFAHKGVQENGKKIIEKIRRGEKVTNEDRFNAIKNIFTCSSRDWSTDKELWLLYQIALNDGSEDEE